MSYGWLTESALLPHKSKNIEVDSKSFLDLKVNILKEKEKLKIDRNTETSSNVKQGKSSSTKISFKTNYRSINEAKTNPKELNKVAQEEEPDYRKIQDTLSKKQEIYDKLMETRHNALNKDSKNIKSMSLVDFDLKKVEHNIPLIQNMTNNKNLEDNIEIAQDDRILVKQQYDNVLSKQEKKALKEILKEEKSFKDQLMFLKKKKEKEREDRLDRIQKMKNDASDKQSN